MKFLFSDLTICRALESFGIKETKPWIDRIRDDFEEKMSNNEIVARFLEIQPNKIFQFVNDTLLVDEFVRRIKKPEWVVQDCEDLMIRVRVLAYIITNDALNFSYKADTSSDLSICSSKTWIISEHSAFCQKCFI